MEQNDMRAFVPASLVNKTRSTLDQLQWVKTALPGALGTVTFQGIRFWVTTQLTHESGPCSGSFSYIGPPETTVDQDPESHPDTVWNQPNSWESSSDDPLFTTYARADIRAEILGFPTVFNYLADDCTILSAQANVRCSASYQKKDYTVTPPSSYTEDISTEMEEMEYTVFAINRSNEIEVVGGFSGTPDNRYEAVDMTDVIQGMWARKRDGDTVGFAVVPGFATAVVSGDGWGFLNSLKPPVTRSTWIPEGATCEEWYASAYTFRYLTWFNPEISDLRIKIQYPEYDSTDVVTPRWPVLD